MEYCNTLNRSIGLYKGMAREFYGLIEMPLGDIFKGLHSMNETPEDLWGHISDNFGHHFFLPHIQKHYGHLFVKDAEAHQDQIKRTL